MTNFTFDGFEPANTTPVPDVLFDELLSELNESELKVLLYIIRRTAGFKKQTDAISLTQFQKGIRRRATGEILDKGCGVKDRATIVKALASLEKIGCIESTKSSDPQGDKATSSYRVRFRSGVVGKTNHHTDIGSGQNQPPWFAKPTTGSGQNQPGVVGDSNPQETVIQLHSKQETDSQEGTYSAGETATPAASADAPTPAPVQDEATLERTTYKPDLAGNDGHTNYAGKTWADGSVTPALDAQASQERIRVATSTEDNHGHRNNAAVHHSGASPADRDTGPAHLAGAPDRATGDAADGRRRGPEPTQVAPCLAGADQRQAPVAAELSTLAGSSPQASAKLEPRPGAPYSKVVAPQRQSNPPPAALPAKEQLTLLGGQVRTDYETIRACRLRLTQANIKALNDLGEVDGMNFVNLKETIDLIEDQNLVKERNIPIGPQELASEKGYWSFDKWYPVVVRNRQRQALKASNTPPPPTFASLPSYAHMSDTEYYASLARGGTR